MLRWSGPLAVLVAVVAVVVAGTQLPGYDPLQHPVSLLGARGVPGGQLFSVMGFGVPGLLAAVAAGHLGASIGGQAPRALRIGAQMLLLAGLAYAAMGVFALDAADIENRASQWHASAWLLWLVAFCAGAAALGAGAWADRRWRPVAALALACAAVTAGCALVLPAVLPAAMAQRLAFGGWLLWLGLGAWLYRRV